MISCLRVSDEVTNDTCIQDGGRDGELKRQLCVLKNKTRLSWFGRIVFKNNYNAELF